MYSQALKPIFSQRKKKKNTRSDITLNTSLLGIYEWNSYAKLAPPQKLKSMSVSEKGTVRRTLDDDETPNLVWRSSRWWHNSRCALVKGPAWHTVHCGSISHHFYEAQFQLFACVHCITRDNRKIFNFFKDAMNFFFFSFLVQMNLNKIKLLFIKKKKKTLKIVGKFSFDIHK